MDFGGELSLQDLMQHCVSVSILPIFPTSFVALSPRPAGSYTEDAIFKNTFYS